ncbi:MAG: hypothetical protein AAGG02_02430 [Cyanobacteria bacterium P01_H01_bin.15]
MQWRKILGIGIATVATFYLIWTFVSSGLRSLFLAWGFSEALTELLLGILFATAQLETVLKIMLLQLAIRPAKFVETSLSQLPHSDQQAIQRQSRELQQRGFIKLLDYTVPGTGGMARLFGHPDWGSFVELGYAPGLPLFANSICFLEPHWSLELSNAQPNLLVDMVWFAFLRQPRALCKRQSGVSPAMLINPLLLWRQQVRQQLGLAAQRQGDLATYITAEREKRQRQRQALLNKSMSYALLQALWYPFSKMRQHFVWLGDSIR